jgi:AraC-like DNA-binding protein
MTGPGFQKPLVSPVISLSGARAAYVGPGLDLAPHRNAAATLAVALVAPFALALPPDAAAEARAVALIPPNARHHLRADGPMAFIYLDALADDHRRLQTADLAAGQRRLAEDGAAAVGAWGVDALCAAFGIPARGTGDPRIAAAVRRIDARPQDVARLADAAAEAGLSASRFQALFAAAVGMPFRRYRLWRRMAVVMRALGEGHDLTAAAHEAGFASSAHLSTTFRDMFGLPPSALVARGIRIAFADPATRPRFSWEEGDAGRLRAG